MPYDSSDRSLTRVDGYVCKWSDAIAIKPNFREITPDQRAVILGPDGDARHTLLCQLFHPAAVAQAEKDAKDLQKRMQAQNSPSPQPPITPETPHSADRYDDMTLAELIAQASARGYMMPTDITIGDARITLRMLDSQMPGKTYSPITAW